MREERHGKAGFISRFSSRHRDFASPSARSMAHLRVIHLACELEVEAGLSAGFAGAPGTGKAYRCAVWDNIRYNEYHPGELEEGFAVFGNAAPKSACMMRR